MEVQDEPRLDSDDLHVDPNLTKNEERPALDVLLVIQQREPCCVPAPVRGLGSWASLTDYTSDLAQGRGPGIPEQGAHQGKESTLPARS